MDLKSIHTIVQHLDSVALFTRQSIHDKQIIVSALRKKLIRKCVCSTCLQYNTLIRSFCHSLLSLYICSSSLLDSYKRLESQPQLLLAEQLVCVYQVRSSIRVTCSCSSCVRPKLDGDSVLRNQTIEPTITYDPVAENASVFFSETSESLNSSFIQSIFSKLQTHAGDLMVKFDNIFGNMSVNDWLSKMTTFQPVTLMHILHDLITSTSYTDLLGVYGRLLEYCCVLYSNIFTPLLPAFLAGVHWMFRTLITNFCKYLYSFFTNKEDDKLANQAVLAMSPENQANSSVLDFLSKILGVDDPQKWVSEKAPILVPVMTAILFAAVFLGRTSASVFKTTEQMVRKFQQTVGVFKDFDSLIKSAKTSMKEMLKSMFGLIGLTYMSDDEAHVAKFRQKLLDLQQEALKYKKRIDLNPSDIMCSDREKQRVAKFDDDLKDLWSEMIKHPTCKENLSNLKPLYDDIKTHTAALRKWSVEVDLSLKPRQVPTVMCFSGNPGIGKSFLIQQLVRSLSAFEGRQLTMYSRNCGDKYVSVYQGQDIFIFDEWGANKEDLDSGELLAMVSPAPYLLNKSDNAEKGTPFTSRYIILNTNMEKIPFDNKNLRDVSALYRRRHFHFAVSNPAAEQFKLINDRYPESHDLLDGQTIFKPDCSHLVMRRLKNVARPVETKFWNNDNTPWPLEKIIEEVFISQLSKLATLRADIRASQQPIVRRVLPREVIESRIPDSRILLPDYILEEDSEILSTEESEDDTLMRENRRKMVHRQQVRESVQYRTVEAVFNDIDRARLRVAQSNLIASRQLNDDATSIEAESDYTEFEDDEEYTSDSSAYELPRMTMRRGVYEPVNLDGELSDGSQVAIPYEHRVKASQNLPGLMRDSDYHPSQQGPPRLFNQSDHGEAFECVSNGKGKIFLFLGPPGSGKTTLARRVCSSLNGTEYDGPFDYPSVNNDVILLNDITSGPEFLDCCYRYALNCGDGTRASVLIMTANPHSLARLLTREQYRVLRRRVNLYNFSFKRKNFLSSYNESDVEKRTANFSAMVQIDRVEQTGSKKEVNYEMLASALSSMKVEKFSYDDYVCKCAPAIGVDDVRPNVKVFVPDCVNMMIDYNSSSQLVLTDWLSGKLKIEGKFSMMDIKNVLFGAKMPDIKGFKGESIEDYIIWFNNSHAELSRPVDLRVLITQQNGEQVYICNRTTDPMLMVAYYVTPNCKVTEEGIMVEQKTYTFNNVTKGLYEPVLKLLNTTTETLDIVEKSLVSRIFDKVVSFVTENPVACCIAGLCVTGVVAGIIGKSMSGMMSEPEKHLMVETSDNSILRVRAPAPVVVNCRTTPCEIPKPLFEAMSATQTVSTYTAPVMSTPVNFELSAAAAVTTYTPPVMSSPVQFELSAAQSVSTYTPPVYAGPTQFQQEYKFYANEACIDPAARELVEFKLYKNVCPLYKNGERVCWVTFVRDQFAISVAHAFPPGAEAKDYSTDVNGCMYKLDNFVVARDRDLAVLRFEKTCPAQPNIIKHIVFESELKNFEQQQAVMPIPFPKGFMLNCITLRSHTYAGDVSRFGLSYHGGLDHYSTSSPIQTKAGDCGTPIVLINPNACRKIVSMHSAASTVDGLGAILTQESVLQGIEAITFKNESRVEAAQKIEFLGFEVAGKIPEQMIPMRQTKLWTCPKEIRNPETEFEPCLMSKFDTRMPETETGDPYYECASKWALKPVPIDLDELDICVDEWADHFAQACRSTDRPIHVYKKTAAINSIEGCDTSKTMKIHSSAGYPWKLWSDQKNKYLEFVPQQEGGYWKIRQTELGQKLNYSIDKMIENAKLGERPEALFMVSMKDELLKKKKIYDVCGTRTICAAPLDYSIAIRMYFHGAASLIMESRRYHPIKVGIVCQSMEWNTLYHYLVEKSDVGFDADYKAWDSTVSLEIIKRLPKIYNKIYQMCDPNWKPVDDEVRKALHRAVSEPQVLIHCSEEKETYVCNVKRGHVSGQPNTAIDNSLANCIVYYYIWRQVFKNDVKMKTFSEFLRCVRFAVNGDDNICAIDRSVIHKFNFNTFALVASQIGLTVTDAAKDGNSHEYRPVKDFEFLKRTFQVLNQGIATGPLLPQVFDKTTSCFHLKNHDWFREKDRIGHHPDKLIQICENLLEEAALLGFEYHSKWKTRVGRFFGNQRIQHHLKSWHDIITQFGLESAYFGSWLSKRHQ